MAADSHIRKLPRMAAGQRYGRLTAIKFVATVAHSQKLWLFKCDCGNEVTSRASSARFGSTRSCGCLHAADRPFGTSIPKNAKPEKKSNQLSLDLGGAVFPSGRSFVSTRESAVQLGLKSYFTGVPCRYGHVAPRTTVSDTCFECQKIANRTQRIKNPEIRLLHNARQRARKSGMEVNITHADLVFGERCPCCGEKFQRNPSLRKRMRYPHSPTVDRIDNTKGYTPGNVAVICWHCNRIKSDGTMEDHKRIVQWLTKVLPK